MSEQAILNAIDVQTRRRRKAWSERDVATAQAAAERLEELYKDLRIARAEARSGDRESIVKRARIELELEKVREA